MYVCTYVYYACIYVLMYVCMCVMYVYMYVCIYVYVCYICIYVFMYVCIYVCMYIMYVYRVSQEERPKLREGVLYVELYRYNPKHLCPKLNGYGDNGQRGLKV